MMGWWSGKGVMMGWWSGEGVMMGWWSAHGMHSEADWSDYASWGWPGHCGGERGGNPGLGVWSWPPLKR